jgi:cell division protein FtsN
MPKDYKHITKRTPKTETKAGSTLPFFTGLAVGLLVAVTVYFYENQPASEVIPQQDNSDTVASTTNIATASEQEHTESLPEPHFDFYKILPSREVNISEWETREDEQPEDKSQQPVMYVLQVGSFSHYEAADEIKAKLAMLGITADIQRVVINGQDIRHRVRIGPYKDTEKLQEARDRLLANELDFMLLKLKMDDI